MDPFRFIPATLIKKKELSEDTKSVFPLSNFGCHFLDLWNKGIELTDDSHSDFCSGCTPSLCRKRRTAERSLACLSANTLLALYTSRTSVS
jgi:hypothetical protein